MSDNFDWNALQSFLAVARVGRLTLAARRLGIDHSTLSRRLLELERSLQARLFDRAPGGYTLTSAGERLLISAQAIESLALTTLTDVAGSSLEISGAIRIGAPDGFGTAFLAPCLGRLGRRHPQLDIQLVTMPRVFSLSKREADIAIGLARPEEGRLHARKLTDYELGLYAAASYLAGSGTIENVASLNQHRFIGYIGEMIYAPELDYVPLVSRDVRPALTSSNLLAQHAAAAAGHGLCVLPCFLAQTDARLQRVLPEAVSLKRSFWMVVHADLRGLARVRVTAEFIAAEAREAASLFLPANPVGEAIRGSPAPRP